MVTKRLYVLKTYGKLGTVMYMTDVNAEYVNNVLHIQGFDMTWIPVTPEMLTIETEK